MRTTFNILIKVIVLSLLSLVYKSCQKYPTVQFKLIKNIECEGVHYNSQQILSRTKITDDNTYLYFINRNNDIGAFDLNRTLNGQKENWLNEFETGLVFHKSLLPSQFFFHRSDSLFFIDPIAKIAYIYDNSLRIIKKIRLPDIFEPLIDYEWPIITDDNCIYYIYLSDDANVRTQQSRIKYFNSVKPISKVSFHQRVAPNDSTNLFGDFPHLYKKTGNNYYDFDPTLSIGKNNLVILTFNSDHNIYVYKDSKLINVKSCKSKYIDKFKDLPDDLFRNLEVVKKYQGLEPKYLKIVYDPFKKLYYRIVKHRFHGLNTRAEDASWSIIILNDQFEFIDEVRFKYSETLPDVIIPSKDGLYLKKQASIKEDIEKNLILSLFEIKQ